MLMQVPSPNHVLAAFNSIYDSPDLQQAIGQNWPAAT